MLPLVHDEIVVGGDDAPAHGYVREKESVVHHHQVGRFRPLTGAHQEAASIQDEGTGAAQAVLILGREAIPEHLLARAEAQLGAVAALGLG